MNTVYSKITEGRKEKYNISTSILVDGNNKYVKKSAIGSDFNHIKRIKENEIRLRTIYKDMIIEGKLLDDSIIYPYVEGTSLEDYILNGDIEFALNKYIEILDIAKTPNFKKSEEFIDILGDIDFHSEGLKYGNLDLTFSNIIISKDKSYIIDYEWVLDNELPRSLVLYRALMEFKSHFPNVKLDYENIYEKYNLNEIDNYNNALNNFSNYVLDEFNFRKKYEKKENYFDPKVNYSSLSNENANLNKDNYKLHKDNLILISKTTELRKSIDILNVRIAEKHRIIDQLNNHMKDTTNNNLNELLSKESFINELKDDIKELKSGMEDYNNLIIKLDSNINSLVNEVSNKDMEIARLNKDLNSLMDKYKELDDLKEHYKMEYENYQNSTTFKLMKPWWKVRDFMIPKNSKRRLFLKLTKTAICHPIWTLKHLNRQNIRKVKMYSKSEGNDRVIERLSIYKDNTTPIGNTDGIEVFNMEPRNEYPKLLLPKFKNVKVSIIIPVYNQFPYTYGCIESIIKNTKNIPYEVIIGDDCSTDETIEIEKYVENIIVNRNKENLRFLLNCKNAAKLARGEYLFFLNNDTNVQEGWLESLFDTLDKFPNAGMVGSKLIYPNGSLQEAGGILWQDGSAWNFGNKADRNRSEFNYRKPVDYISGAAIMISKKLWNKLGGFDETFVPAYCEDSDLAFMVRKAGYDVIYDPFSVVIHYEGVSNGKDTSSGVKKYQVENTKKFYDKWKKVLSNHYPNAENVFIARDRSYNQKHILVIDHYVPQFDKDAGSRTVFNYLNTFVKLGYHVTFLGENFYQDEPYTDILEKNGIEVLYGPYYAKNYESWLNDNGKYFDYVFMNRPHITTKFIDVVIKNCKNAKLIYYGHDLHYVRTMREYEISHDENCKKESLRWKEMEYSIFKKVDLIYYPSITEINEIKSVDPKLNCKVLQPYMYDKKNISYNAKNRDGILFVGGFRHGPNFDGIMWFVKEVFPKILEKNPDIVLSIAGSYPPDELLKISNDNIKVLGFVTDEELDELYRSRRLVIAPLRYGAGIKGKVIEAMSYGVPIITTSCGAEGINSKSLLVDDSLLSLSDLYNDINKLNNMSSGNIKYIEDNYSKKSALELIKRDFKELVK